MHDTFPLLVRTDFPAIRRRKLETLQANLGYRCNQACLHCHVAASPARTEEMAWETMQLLLEFALRHKVTTLDLTGGAPELNPHFRALVAAARGAGLKVIDRCNLTILNEPGHEDLVAFLAQHGVSIVASLPCYLEDNVDRQRGQGVFASSLKGLARLNAAGYGVAGTGLELDLVYNPQGPVLPPAQSALEQAYKEQLARRYGITFNRLLALANMPIKRFGSQLVTHKGFDDYMQLLRGAYRAENLGSVMCRSLISVSWKGEVHDCDFNQMLGMPLGGVSGAGVHLSSLLEAGLEGRPIGVAEHCYGCTAGQGSSCGGALPEAERREAPAGPEVLARA